MTEESIVNAEQLNETEPQNAQKSRTRTKSLYLFPSYDFNMAKMIAETIEHSGGGSLTEETLAINLNLSAKSSGFQLKVNTARQFGLIVKQGDILTTTQLAKAIFKPTSEEEKRSALKESFLKIPLFSAVANRYKGQPIPTSDVFRNVLEREFKIDNQRVPVAERTLMDSARDTSVLIPKGNTNYLSTETSISIPVTPYQHDIDSSTIDPPPEPINEIPIAPKTQSALKSKSNNVTPEKGILPAIAEEDLLGLDDKEFDAFWGAFGKIVRNRAKKSIEQKDDKGSEK
jgi:hypothetical protein